MEEKIKMMANDIAEMLEKGYDILIKKTKENEIKVLYYRPKNLKRVEE